MKPRSAGSWLLALVSAAAACGRSGLYTSDELSLFGGSGGTPGNAAGRGGVGAAAGRGGAGGSVGRAGAGGVGGTAAGAGSGGMPEACPGAQPEIREVVPRNGALASAMSDFVTARYQCPIDRMRATSDNARLYGLASGYVASDFPPAADERYLFLAPRARQNRTRAFFAGELVTAWLSEALGGPYLWQFTAAVRLVGPPYWRPGSRWSYGLPRTSALGDFDGDGDLDVVLEENGSMALLRNKGNGDFETPDLFGDPGAPVAGDVDRDGDLDLAAGGHLLLNQGDGHFTAGTSFGPCTAMGDIDGDGDLDCVANDGYDNATTFGHTAFNDGKGIFSAGPETPFGFECELADLDGDGDLDAACVSPVVEAGRVFLNDGQGAFTRTEQVLGAVGARGMALGDLDADGDVDAVVSQWFGGGKTSPNQVWLNDGEGRFHEAGTIGVDGGSIALGDIDGDGDFDALFSHLTPYGPNSGPFNPIRMYLNDGFAQFSLSQMTLGDPAFHWFKLGDLDQDGDLDAFIYHQVPVGGNYSAVWLNEQ